MSQGLLFDAYGGPLTGNAPMYGPEPHAYGPIRFEHQPAEVRKHGRKGMARMSARGRAKRRSEWAEARGESVSYGSSRRSSRRGSSRKRRYGSFTEAQSAVYGPVPFEEQPRRVRRRGRKSKARGSYYSSGGSSRRGSRRGSRRSTRREYRMSRRSSRSMSRRGSSRPMSLSGVRSYLRQHRSMKGWICVGRTRSGCGGRGARVLGYMR